MCEVYTNDSSYTQTRTICRVECVFETLKYVKFSVSVEEEQMNKAN